MKEVKSVPSPEAKQLDGIFKYVLDHAVDLPKEKNLSSIRVNKMNRKERLRNTL